MTILPIKANRTPAPAKAAPAEPVWISIDPATMPEDLQRLYFAYRKAYDLAESARKLWEEEANEAFDVGADNCLKFGYKFGRLSAAICPKRRAVGRDAQPLTALAKAR